MHVQYFFHIYNLAEIEVSAFVPEVFRTIDVHILLPVVLAALRFARKPLTVYLKLLVGCTLVVVTLHS